MVVSGRNHPSVIAWSIGNEIMEQGQPEGWKVAVHLADIVRSEDRGQTWKEIQFDGERSEPLLGLAGPYDFYPIVNPDAKPVFFHPDYPPKSQPFEFVSADAPRTFLGAARKDKLVDPQRNAVALGKRLKDAGVPVQVKLYRHVGHITLAASMAAPLRWLAPVLDDVALFIDTGRPVPRQMPEAASAAP